ncbi:MAG: nucleotidyltransferase family protein [Chitinophagales bacterium]
MKIIIPMAGWGSRLRPHTLTIPKPMVQIAGKPIVQRLVESLATSVDEAIEEINFIIREEFGKATEEKLLEVAKSLGTKGIISYQDSPEGTAHAIYCAKESLEGNIIVAFADTLFKTDFKIDASKDGVIWVSKVEDPRAFGVVKLDSNNVITDFVEKPENFVSDLAIIGIYYFKDGLALKKEIEYLLENDIREKGEYQLTNALENLKTKGHKFVPGEAIEWLDCCNKDACVYIKSASFGKNKV